MLRLKKFLRDKLSISSRLFVREMLVTSARTVRAVIVAPGLLTNRIAGRLGIRVAPVAQATDSPISALAAVASESTSRLIAEKQRFRDASPVLVQTSIIIPVFNKAEYTVQCLSWLLREIDLSVTEIIIVDNASSDDTESALTHFGNLVRVIRNTENHGFVDACNQGAASARGKYLVFLNNDTTVMPGWLDSLVTTIEAAPLNGAVGSMFLYPNGSIQEAGGIVWQDGQAHHYGGGASPDDHRFNFAREVDYCSAASLLIRKDIFQRLGGFDRRFAPAYYEDVDLCFGVRSLGYKVIYQPESRLLHYEGITAGSDISLGFKRFQIINGEKFVEKWRAVLATEQLRRDWKEVDAASDRNRERPTVLVFDERVPSPDRDAGSLRMFMILKVLASWCHVTFVPFSRPQDLGYERALWREGIETAESAVDWRRLLKRRKVLAAILSRPSMGTALLHRIRRIDPKVGIIFDMVDTHFIRCQREYEISGDANALAEANHYRHLEPKLAQASDLVWCASLEDKSVMESVAPGNRFKVVPTIHALRDPGKQFADRHGLLFIGNMAHRPNEDAVLFFLSEVYPRLQGILPNVRLEIIGDNPSPAIRAYNSELVRILGYVPDVEPSLRDARVFIAPLRFGAGIKGKVGEAMAHGIPVVTSAIGAEGFGLVHGVDVMLADEPESFAMAIHALYTQKILWNRLAKNSHRIIEEHFIPGVIAKTISSSIKEVGARAGE